MFIVDSKGGALGSTRIRVAAFSLLTDKLDVRQHRGHAVAYTPRDNAYEAFFFALGCVLAGASDVLLVTR